MRINEYVFGFVIAASMNLIQTKKRSVFEHLFSELRKDGNIHPMTPS